MRRHYVRDGSNSDRSSKRQKFIDWLETEEITTTENSHEENIIENGSATELSDIDITNILHDELEKGSGFHGQSDAITAWLNGSGGQQLPVDGVDHIDWDLMLQSLEDPSPSEIKAGSSSEMVGGQSGVYSSDDEFTEITDTLTEDLEDCVQEYGRLLYSTFVTGRHRYLSTVVVPPRHVGIDRIVEELKCMVKRYPPNHWYIFASHGDHVHIGHICAYTNDSCRCLWIRNSQYVMLYRKRQLRRITRAVQLEPNDYASIMRYLCAGARLIEGVGGVNQHEGICNRYKYLSVCHVKLFNEITI